MITLIRSEVKAGIVFKVIVATALPLLRVIELFLGAYMSTRERERQTDRQTDS